jgi:hypothetical protein
VNLSRLVPVGLTTYAPHLIYDALNTKFLLNYVKIRSRVILSVPADAWAEKTLLFLFLVNQQNADILSSLARKLSFPPKICNQLNPV